MKIITSLSSFNMKARSLRARFSGYSHIGRFGRCTRGSRANSSLFGSSNSASRPQFLKTPQFLLPKTSIDYRSVRTMSTPISQFSLDPGVFNSEFISRICALWFPNLPLPASAPTRSQMSRWFGVGASVDERAGFDAHCHAVASEALISIGPENLAVPAFTGIDSDQVNYPHIAAPFVKYIDGEKGIEKQATGALGLILLLDQMTRNCYRNNQSLIYAHYDRMARAVSHATYARDLDKSSQYRHSPPWRVWFYLPMMHSEALSDHEVFSQNLEEMRAYAEAQGDTEAVGYVNHTLNYEKRYYDVLVKFGRYPHRNKVLGRQSTTEEREYLESGGDTFGT